MYAKTKQKKNIKTFAQLIYSVNFALINHVLISKHLKETTAKLNKCFFLEKSFSWAYTIWIFVRFSVIIIYVCTNRVCFAIFRIDWLKRFLAPIILCLSNLQTLSSQLMMFYSTWKLDKKYKCRKNNLSFWLQHSTILLWIVSHLKNDKT